MLWHHSGARRGTCDTCCGVMDERARGTSACFALLFVAFVASFCFFLLLVASCCFLILLVAFCFWDSWCFFLGQAGLAYDTWRGVMGERAALLLAWNQHSLYSSNMHSDKLIVNDLQIYIYIYIYISSLHALTTCQLFVFPSML
jgi:hypothetical protein